MLLSETISRRTSGDEHSSCGILTRKKFWLARTIQLRRGIGVAVPRILSLILGFVGLFLSATLYGAEARGIVAHIAGWSTVIATMFSGGLSYALFADTVALKEMSTKVKISVLIYGCITSTIFGIVTFAAVQFYILGSIFGDNMLFFLGVTISIPFSVLAVYCPHLASATGMVTAYYWYVTIGKAISLLLIIIFYYFGVAEPAFLLIALTSYVPTYTLCLFSCVFTRHGFSRGCLHLVPKMLRTGIRGYPADLAYLATGMGDIILMKAYVTFSELGIYQFCKQLLVLFGQLMQPFGLSIMRRIQSDGVECTAPTVRKLTLCALGVSLVAGFGSAIGGSQIGLLLFKEQADLVGHALLVVSTCLFGSACWIIAESVLVGSGQHRQLSIYVGVISVGYAAALYTLGSIYGLNGILAALVLLSAVRMVFASMVLGSTWLPALRLYQ